MSTPVRVTADDVSAYERDGAVCLRQVFDQEWVAQLLSAADSAMARPGPWAHELTASDEPGRFHMNTFMWRWNQDMRGLALKSPMIDIAVQLLRPEKLIFFYDELLAKEPGTKDITRWHQDLPYWPLRGDGVISIWLALTSVTDDLGGVQYVAGSHKWNRLFRAITPEDNPDYVDSALELCPDFFDTTIRRKNRLLSWSLSPGDVVCHHPLVIHGARGHSSDSERRIGVCLRYADSKVRWDPRPHVMRFAGDPERFLEAGDPLDLNDVFPVIWECNE